MIFARRKIKDLIVDGAILDVQDGNHGEKHPTSAEYVDQGIPFVMARDFRDGHLDLQGSCKIPKPLADSLRIGFAYPGDVLLTHKGTIGMVALVPGVPEYVMLTPQVTYYRTNQTKLLNSYLKYAFQAPRFKQQLYSFSAQSTRPYVGITAQKELELDIPPLIAQERIASILSSYDELIENNQRRIRILEEMARALYREWFVQFRFPGNEGIERVASPLGEIPEGWEVKKLKEVCKLTMGQSPKSEFYNQAGEGEPFHQGVSDFGKRFPTGRLYCTAEGRIAEDGDILFSVRAPVGRMNVANKRIIIGRGLSAIRHMAGHQAFLWEHLRNRFTEDDMMGNGAIFAAVTKHDMENIDILCPTKTVLFEAEKHLIPLHELIAILADQIQNLRHTRDLLLPRLMSGQIELKAE